MGDDRRSVRSAQIRSWSMAAARNVSAAARMTGGPRAARARELADRRGLAGAVDADDEHDRRSALDGGPRLPGEVARARSAASSARTAGFGTAGSRRLRAARRGPSPAPRRRRRRSASPRPRPRRARPAPPKGRATGHEPAARPLEAGVDRARLRAARRPSGSRRRAPARALGLGDRGGLGLGGLVDGSGSGSGLERGLRQRARARRPGSRASGPRSRPGPAPSRARPPRVRWPRAAARASRRGPDARSACAA